MNKSKDNLYLDYFSSQFLHDSYLSLFENIGTKYPSFAFPLSLKWKRQEHSLLSTTKWTVDNIIHIKYANKKMLTKQPGSIPSTFLVPLLIPQKKLYLVSIIVNKITSKFINLLVN